MTRYIIVSLQLILLLFGPLVYACMVYANWCAGYRTKNWMQYQGYAMGLLMLGFLWFPLVLAMITYLAGMLFGETKYRLSRIIMLLLAVVFIVTLPTFYLHGLGSDSFDNGRKAMQSELDLRQLAEDCMTLIRKQAGKDYWMIGRDEVEDAIAFSPSIKRLRPNSISIDKTQGVGLELCGGFDHYGYALRRSDKPKQWILYWYTESSEENLLSINEPE